jgi:single-strand DNA-binding protein
MYLNKVFIFGNLTREPELRSLPTGSKVAQMGVATNRVWKDQSGKKQESTEFHNVVVFGRQAEIAAQYLKKGSTVFLEGRLQTRSWEKDGEKKSRTEIVVDRMQFGPRAGGGSAGGSAPSMDEDQSPRSDKGGAIEYPEEDINPDDIPF